MKKHEDYLETVGYDKDSDLDFNREGFPVSLESKLLFSIFGSKAVKHKQNPGYPLQKDLTSIFDLGYDDDDHFSFEDLLNIIYANDFDTLSNMNSQKLKDLSIKLKMLYVKLNEEQVKRIDK